MARELIQTGNRKLGETGKRSDYAIGVPFTHPNVLDPTVWTAASELGKTLEALCFMFQVQPVQMIYFNGVW